MYLAYGHLKGWEGEVTRGRLSRDDLRDLFLEAHDVQQRYMAGPVKAASRARVDSNLHQSGLRVLYGKGLPKPSPKTAAEAEYFTDIWEEALRDKFFEAVSTVKLAKLPDGDPMLVTGWGSVEKAHGQKFRATRIATYPTGRSCLSCLGIKQPAGERRLLVRLEMVGDVSNTMEGTKIALSTSGAVFEDAVCRRRWVHWLLPARTNIDQLTIEAEESVRVYAVEVYRERGRE
jgi:hypothetical protein